MFPGLQWNTTSILAAEILKLLEIQHHQNNQSRIHGANTVQESVRVRTGHCHAPTMHRAHSSALQNGSMVKKVFGSKPCELE